jgi:hypothetical protein
MAISARTKFTYGGGGGDFEMFQDLFSRESAVTIWPKSHVNAKLKVHKIQQKMSKTRTY